MEKKIEKTIACPKCKHIITISGKPGMRVRILCPKCETTGFFQFPGKKGALSFLYTHSITYIAYILTAFSIIISFFLKDSTDFFILLPFIFLIPLFVLFRFDATTLIGYAFITLFLSALTLGFYKDETIARHFAINSYWLLVVGGVCLFIEYLRKFGTIKIKRLLV